MAAKVHVATDGDGRTWWHFDCPGCGRLHGVNDTWTLNGDVNRPTIQPSVLSTWNEPDGHGGKRKRRCHLFVTDGKIQFCDDSEHDLRGQTVEMLDVA